MSYSGPPPNLPPSPGWRPPTVVRPDPPRPLPPQDYAALDAAERAARSATWLLAGTAGLIMLIVACILFGRLVT